MKKVCGWCLKAIDQISDTGNSLDDQDLTTGICEDCADFLLRNTSRRDMTAFLNTLPIPVVVVSGGREVQFANDLASKVVGSDFNHFEGRLLGEAVECARSRLPGGCGKTVHCKACAIKKAIEETYETGQAQSRKTALLKRDTEDGEKDFHFIISTEKVGDLVYLKVEEVIGSA